MNITYLEHSGFVIEDTKRYYIFDMWRDEKRIVSDLSKTGKALWFFVSHFHGDHVCPTMGEFDSPTTRYFMHKDVVLNGIQESHHIALDVDDDMVVEGVHIHMYGSTDTGGSFFVDTGEKSFFHAGDLNWWHWPLDKEVNNKKARVFWERELERLGTFSVDILFFPVDARLESAREWGLKEVLEHISVRQLLVPMHMHDDGWIPSDAFLGTYPGMPLWVVQESGATYVVN